MTPDTAPASLKDRIRLLKRQANAAFDRADFAEWERLTEERLTAEVEANANLQAWLDARPGRREQMAATEEQYRALYNGWAATPVSMPKGANDNG